MSSQFPNGTIFAVSTVLSAAVVISATSNANPAVASSAAPPADDSVVLLSSNWPGLNEVVARTDLADSDSFALLGVNTTNVNRYSPGEGSGFFQVASSFINLSQVREVTKSGGEQQFFQFRYLEDNPSRQRQKPTFKNAKSILLTLDWDPALAWYEALREADSDQEIIVLRATLPNDDVLYYGVYPSFDDDPSMTIDENMTNTATFSMTAGFTRYAAP
jgi:hypothetical protein